MAISKTTTVTLSDEMKTFYDRLLLERTVPVLLYSKFATRRPIPKHGGKIIEFRKFSAMTTATTPLTEGDPPSARCAPAQAEPRAQDQRLLPGHRPSSDGA
jgi:N4-gp56 family major capsid protein